jgi:hypothetical protein
MTPEQLAGRFSDKEMKNSLLQRTAKIQGYGSLVQSLTALVNSLSAYNAAQSNSRRN